MHERSLRILEFDKIKEKIKKYTKSPVGRELIDVLKPYNTVKDVQDRLIETNEALNIIMKKSNPPFEGLYDIREGVSRAGKGAALQAGQLLKIAQAMSCARRFKTYVKSDDDTISYKKLQDLCAGITPLKFIEDRIFTAIISEEEVSDKASEKLFSIRRSLKSKGGEVKDKVGSLVRTYSSFLQENLYTVRGDRYVIPVKAEHKGSVKGLVHDISASGATLFIEPISLVNLNNEIKELMIKERAEIEKILAELSAIIYENHSVIKINCDIIWELDFIFAKAKYASELNCSMPIINDEGIIDIVQGRHPLISQDEVIANDIYTGKHYNSLVITGPNTGGKTVTLKTLGLIQIMALSGLMIPARDGSTVSFFEDVYADIGDEQSIEQSLSTFSSHMTNIVHIMENANEKSLVLFDELGAGTDPTEGAALAISILEDLRKRGCRIAATTHYSELKGYALKTEGVENGSVEFDVNTLRPTYRLLIGVPGKSNAFEISRRLGLSDYIIDIAKSNISDINLEFESLIESLQNKKIQAEKNERESLRIKMEAQKIKERYQEKSTKLENVRDKAIIEAQREAKMILKQAKEEADEILKNIRKMESMGYSSEARQQLEKERLKLRDKIASKDKAISITEQDKGNKLKTVHEGQIVLLTTLNQKVTVLNQPNSKGEVMVQAGIMKVTVKVDQLRACGQGDTVSEFKNKKRSKGMKLKMSSVKSSVDLRGMDSQEALMTVDKYLDDAYLGGLGEVTIIHGLGTGVLKKAVTDMLRRHNHVKEHRPGAYGEGGAGVTIAILK